MQLPYTLTNGSSLDASQIQANFTALRDAHDQVRNANIVADAGIDKSKLAQTGLVSESSFLLVPATSNGSLDTGADAAFTLPAAFQRKHSMRIRMGTGQIGALAYIEVEPEEVAIGGADWPEIEILIDGVQFMGQSVVLDTSQGRYVFGNADPIANPGYPLSSDSRIEFNLRRTGAGAPTIRQCSVTVGIKKDLVAM